MKSLSGIDLRIVVNDCHLTDDITVTHGSSATNGRTMYLTQIDYDKLKEQSNDITRHK